MDKETAKQEIRSRVRCTDYLEKSKSGLYNCPFCHSGEGIHHTGALKVYDTNTWTCHKCGKNGDVIDLYRERTGADFRTALRELAQTIGVTIDEREPAPYGSRAVERENHENCDLSDSITREGKYIADHHKTPCSGSETEIEGVADFTNYYKACQERLNDPAAISYLQSRGIRFETAAAYGLGFDETADPATAPGAMGAAGKRHPCPRLIIPVNQGYYLARRIDGIKDFDKLNSKGGTVGIFNLDVLYEKGVGTVFVTEGVFNALSVIEVGWDAIALNSANNAELLIKHLEERQTKAVLILALDNDGKGNEAENLLKKACERLKINYITANISVEYNDPNEAFIANEKKFSETVYQVALAASEKPDNTANYVASFMTGDIDRFKNAKETGFANLDEKTNGLYEGLYVLAAISSLGKTSFALQLADQLAERGNDVIFFSLEQSKLELVSKSLARMTVQESFDDAVTSLSIRRGYLPKNVVDASHEYALKIGKRLSVVEGNFNCDISFIGDYIRRYAERNQVKPVVILDYLQILQPAVDDIKRKSTKEMIDNTVTTLKRICREVGITLLVISSVNRANYTQPIDFESLKESGGIEYTADVIWGLQLQCVNDEDFIGSNLTQKRQTIKEEKAKNPRKIELCCLKNRYGVSSYSCYFYYYPANDLFVEQKEEPEYSITFQNCGKQKKANRKL